MNKSSEIGKFYLLFLSRKLGLPLKSSGIAAPVWISSETYGEARTPDWHRHCELHRMENDVKNKTGLRIKRLMSDEWAMIALLAAAVVQTGAAVHEMNRMVEGAGQPMGPTTARMAQTTQSRKALAASGKVALAASRQNGVKVQKGFLQE